MIDTATAKQLLQSNDVAEIQAVVLEYKDHENPDVSLQYQILKLLLLLQNRILQLQQQKDEATSTQSLTYSGMAKCWMQMGDLEKCQGQLTKALALDSSNVHALILQGEVQSAQAKYDKAIEYTQTAIDLLQSKLSSQRASTVILDLAQAYSKLASVYEMMGEFQKALTVLQSSAVSACAWTNVVDDNDLLLPRMVEATVYGHLGTIQEKLGQYADAVSSLTRAVPACQSCYGPKHTKTVEMEYLLEMATATTAKA